MKLEPFAIDPDKGEEDLPTTYDWDVKETVLWQVLNGEVEFACVIDSPEGPNGMASYCQDEGGMLDYVLSSEKSEDGYYVSEGCTGAYFKGDGWEIEDSLELYVGSIRSATQDEIKEWGLIE